MDDTSSISGYMENGFEGVSKEFTQLEALQSHGVNRFTRAKRYGRWYLLKSLNNESRDKLIYQEMLRKEFDIMMRLQHPGVVQTIGMETVEPFGQCIIMEWVEGVTLKKWLEGETTRDERLHVAEQLLDTLSHIHSQGIAHRDIKPSNIMVTTNGKNVKIIDFGLADTDAHAILKQPAGTKQYMAPEQASTSQPDVRNDIYSLGLVLRQMNLGKDYKKVAEKCIRPIDERYQSVDELKNDLAHRKARRRNISMGLAALGTAALITTITLLAIKFGSRDANKVVVEDNKARQQVDSLRNVLSKTASDMQQSQLKQDSMRQHMSGMNDTIAALNASNTQLRKVQQAIDERERLVNNVIGEGLRIIDAANAATHLKEHVDTLSNAEYLWMDWHFQCLTGERKIPDYMNSIRNKFTSKELAEIEYALKEHCSNYENQMIEKLYKIKNFYLTID
jgi:serine/threonine protein kinase